MISFNGIETGYNSSSFVRFLEEVHEIKSSTIAANKYL